jgi:hypothetical protein
MSHDAPSYTQQQQERGGYDELMMRASPSSLPSGESESMYFAS